MSLRFIPLIPVVPHLQNYLPYMFELQIVWWHRMQIVSIVLCLRQHLCNRTNCILEILLEWVSFCGIRIRTIITKKENFTAPMRKRIKTPHPISLTSRMCIFTDDFFFHFPRSPPQHFFLLALSPLFLASWKCRVFGTSWTDWFGVGNSTVHNWIKWEFLVF